jgi:hypothetical protein
MAKFIARIRNIFLGKLLSNQAYSNYRAINSKTRIYVRYWADGAIAYEKQAIFQALSDDMRQVTDN